MTQWEFTYVDLYIGAGDINRLHAAHRAIQRLGDEGWEPVGHIRFEYDLRRPQNLETVPKQVRQLMFKRPRD